MNIQVLQNTTDIGFILEEEGDESKHVDDLIET